VARQDLDEGDKMLRGMAKPESFKDPIKSRWPDDSRR